MGMYLLESRYMFNVDKLRTYVTFKQEDGTEHYVKVVTNRKHRAAFISIKMWCSHYKHGNRDISQNNIIYVQYVKKMLLKHNPTFCHIVVNITIKITFF